MRKLDKRSATPLYLQIKEILKERIERGEYAPGERLPTEMELCEMFGVSRITVRQALNELAKEGLLYRQRGSGTYVNREPRIEERVLRVIVPEEPWIPPLRKAARAFNRSHPSRRLKLRIETMGGPEFHAEIVNRVGKGEAPDVALIDWIRLTEFADLRYIEPLDALDPAWVEEFKRDLLPFFVEHNSYRGHLWGLQIDATLAVLWYRRDILEAEGIRPPRTWEELVSAALRFREEKTRRRYGLGPFPVAFPGGPQAEEVTTYILSALIWSAGGELGEEGRLVLDEGARKALGFLHDLVHRYGVTSPEAVDYGWKTVPKLFAEGKVVFAFGGTYEKEFIQELAGWDEAEFRGKVGFVPIPAGPGGEQATTVGGMVYVVFRQSADPGEAFEFLKLVSSPPLMLEFCRRTGRKPTRLSVTEKLDPERDWFIYETSKLFPLARVRPTIPQYVRISEQLRIMLAEVLRNRASIDRAIERTQAIIDALLS
ncbi:extracellular solute-binding protein [Candidatus Bipolaricaulota sp. J31]